MASDPNDVERLLVTGSDEDLDLFHVRVFMEMNAVERRGQTILYTVRGADLEAVLALAREYGVTVQHRADAPDGSPPAAYWPVAVQGKAPGWVP